MRFSCNAYLTDLDENRKESLPPNPCDGFIEVPEAFLEEEASRLKENQGVLMKAGRIPYSSKLYLQKQTVCPKCNKQMTYRIGYDFEKNARI